mgnify:CR=1 FL=1
MNKWDYGGAFERHPIQTGTAVFDNGSRLKAGSLFDPLPDFMLRADCLFVDPPWTQGNMTSFYTKAGLPRPQEDYAAFYSRLFECVEEIMPKSVIWKSGRTIWRISFSKCAPYTETSPFTTVAITTTRKTIVTSSEAPTTRASQSSTAWTRKTSSSGFAKTKSTPALAISAWGAAS